MTEVTRHEPGAFCWAELATTDSGAAKKFYMALFDWGYEDAPAGPGMIYTTLKKGDKRAGALYAMGPDQKGVPPHWNTYVSVPSADRTAGKGEGAGRQGPHGALRRDGFRAHGDRGGPTGGADLPLGAEDAHRCGCHQRAQLSLLGGARHHGHGVRQEVLHGTLRLGSQGRGRSGQPDRIYRVAARRDLDRRDDENPQGMGTGASELADLLRRHRLRRDGEESRRLRRRNDRPSDRHPQRRS